MAHCPMWAAWSGLALLAAPLALPAHAQTVVSADRLDGVPVLTRLAADTLDAGETHRFWFRVADSALGQAWHVPVVVVRGARPGPRLLVTAGIHGDEMNGIDVAQQLADVLNPNDLAGTVTIVPGLNTPGMNNSTRNFTPRGGNAGDNMNRLMPGKAGDGASLGDRYAHRLWHDLMRPNADIAIDLHTQSRGTAYTYFIFAGTPESVRLAKLVAPEIIRLDPGEPGTVETEMNKDGVPAMTIELGGPEVFTAALNAEALGGILRIMADKGMIAASMAPATSRTPFVANDGAAVRSPHGGWARLLVGLNDPVRAGQPVATISDAFGRIRTTLTAPRDGRVSSITTDPRIDEGGGVLRIVWFSDDPKCASGC